jgi:hypothetical protein
MPLAVQAQETVYEAVFDRYEFTASSFGDQFCWPRANVPLTLNGDTITFNDRYPCASGLNVTGTVTLSRPDRIAGSRKQGLGFVLTSPVSAGISAQATFQNGTAALNKTRVAAGLKFQGDNCTVQPSDESGVGPNSMVTKQGSGSCTLGGMSIDYEADNTTPKFGYFVASAFLTVQTTSSTDTLLLREVLVYVYYRFGPPQPNPTTTGLDQKIAAPDSRIRINIRGSDFAPGVVPEFLKTDGTVDNQLLISGVNVINSSEIQAELFVTPDAVLGARSLRVNSGSGNTTVPNALNVVEISLALSQGAKTTPSAERIANHPTVVRARILTPSINPGLTDGVKGLLYVFKGNDQIFGSPFLPTKPQTFLNADILYPRTSYTESERFFLRDSLNFYFGLGDSLTSESPLDVGEYTFAIAVSPNDSVSPPPRRPDLSRDQLRASRDFIFVDKLAAQKFVTTKPFRVLLAVDPRFETNKANDLYNQNSRSVEFLAGAFPVDKSRAKLDVRRTNLFTLDIDGLKPAQGEGRWLLNVLSRMEELLEIINRRLPPDAQFDRIALILDRDGMFKITRDTYMELPNGLSRRNRPACFFFGQNYQVLAHELGHTMGLFDTYDEGDFPNPDSPNPRQFNAPLEGNVVEEGTERLSPIWGDTFTLPVETVSVNDPRKAIPGRNINFRVLSFMGAGTPLHWPDFTEWKYLSKKFGAPAGSAEPGLFSPAAPAETFSGDLLSIHGFLNTSGSLSVTRLDRGTVASVSQDPGDLTIELLNGSGDILSAASFGVDFDQPHAGLLPIAPFNASAPFVVGATQVRIRKNATVLYSRAISANAPTVQLLSPQGGETLGGPFTISWNASDPDGDALTYSILYLRGDGTPVPIATGLTSTSFQWSNPTLGGGGAGGRIVVVAHDGVLEGSATSGAFTVNKGGPGVTILEPKGGISIPAGTEIAFRGAGSDAEDGYLPSSSLSFRSSIDGDFGSGGTVTRVLSQGVHTITLRGVDQDANAAEAAITVTVGPTSSVPVIDSLSPSIGPVNTTVVLAGQNFGSNSVVRFGASTATLISATSTQLVVRVPTGLAAGALEVAVTSAGFTSPPFTFTVTNGRPMLSALSPGTGSTGTPVSLVGTEFDPAANGNTVRFGSVQATVLSAGLDGLVVAVPSGLSEGPTNVTVATAQGLSDPVAFTVTTGPPNTPVIITSLTPSTGPAGTTVIIGGSGFSNVLKKNTVSFGETAATPISTSADSLQVTVPFGLPAGNVNVVVTVNTYPSNPLSFTVSSGANPTPTPGQPGCTPAPANLVSFWRAEGNANDSADGNNGTLTTGPTYAAGKVGQAFNLDGIDDVVSFGNPANLQLAGAMTAEAWIRPDTTFSNYRTVVSKWSQSAQASWGLFITNNTVYGIVGNASGQFVDAAGGNVPFGASAAFTHVAMTYSAAEGIKVYLNGALINSDVSIGNIRNGTDLVRIGNDTDLIGDRYFDGLIDEVSLYSRALSGAEIQGIFNAGSAGKCSGSNPSPTPAPVSQVQNISTRLVVGTGENVAIGGFIVTGSGTKPVIVRAIGPSLANFGVAGALDDPTLELFNGSGNAIAFNDDWLSSGQNQEIAALLPPGDGVEAAIIAALTPGNYTAVLRGYENGTGIALVEVYDLDQGAPSRLANISTRGQVGTGGSVLIGGFIVGKQAQFVVRAIGPSLGAAGIGNALGNPSLELYNGQGTKFDTNDNWQEHPSAGQVSSLGLAPGNGLESAIIQTLSPGNYTAIVRGVGDGTGVGLVEVYSLQ